MFYLKIKQMSASSFIFKLLYKWILFFNVCTFFFLFRLIVDDLISIQRGCLMVLVNSKVQKMNNKMLFSLKTYWLSLIRTGSVLSCCFFESKIYKCGFIFTESVGIWVDILFLFYLLDIYSRTKRPYKKLWEHHVVF